MLHNQSVWHCFASLLSAGLDVPIACCEIICNGQGPVISAEPSHLSWGEIKLLEKKCLNLDLINDSPICAEFNANLVCMSNCIVTFLQISILIWSFLRIFLLFYHMILCFFKSKNKSVWEVEPSSGELEANESISLVVSVLLRDTGKYSDRLLITIFNGKTIAVNLSAAGVGTSIVFDPEISPIFDLGLLFR